MKLNAIIWKSFLRQALWDSDAGDWGGTADAVSALMALHTGNYNASTESDTTMVAHSTAGRSYQFQVTPGLGRVQIMAHAEHALELLQEYIDCNEARTSPLTDADLVTYIRKSILRTKKRSRANFAC